MRFYQLSIQDPSGEMWQVETNGLGFTRSAVNMGPTFSSVYTPWQTRNTTQIGQPNPNALNITFDMPVYAAHEPQGGAVVRVWGLGIKALSQASNLNPIDNAFKSFTLRGGMSKGLPLANPAQQGLITRGKIWQAFGNWQGTEQTLDLILYPGPPPSNYGLPIVWLWSKGQNLQDALRQMIAQAFPDSSTDIRISPNLVAPSDQVGIYANIDAFFKYLYRYTKKLGAQIYGKDYAGVQFAFYGNVIGIFDHTVPGKTVELAFQDLVGQPTWIDVNTIIFPTVMRADIGIADKVTFPTGVLLPYALTMPKAAQPGAPAASSSSFKGSFIVQEMHYFANFRQPDAESWNTTFKAVLENPKSSL